MVRAELPSETQPASSEEDGQSVEAACRPLRADAVRNRQRILEAAEEVFAKEGISVPVDVVAERAGVGVGTLYRHFPTKEALFEAIVVTKLDRLIEESAGGGSGDPTETFFGFLMKMADQASLKHDLFDALAAAGVDVKSTCADKVQALRGSLDRLRQRAVDSGQVRGDVTIDQIMGLVIGACQGVDRPGLEGHEPRSMVGIICDGLRTRP